MQKISEVIYGYCWIEKRLCFEDKKRYSYVLWGRNNLVHSWINKLCTTTAMLIRKEVTYLQLQINGT